MRSVSVALAALIGAVAANPAAEYWPRNYYGNPQPTGHSSSTSSYAPPSSSSSYVHPSSSLPSSVYPSSSPSSSTYYPSSSSTKSSGTGHSSVVPSSSKPPTSTDVTTDIITTYTTTTVCPVTYTSGTQVITRTTTSTITVTSCKGGCHHQPTPPSTPVVPPSNPTGPVTIPTTITTTTYTFVPCSTSVGHNGNSVIYSTYLTSSYITKTYTTDVVYYPTQQPQPPVVTPPVATPPANCPAQATVTVYAPGPCKECEVKTYTITEGGSKTTITVTIPSTHIPSQPSTAVNSSKPPHTNLPPVSTGGSALSSIPHSTGYVPYPTKGNSEVPSSSSRSGPKPTGYPTGYGY